jgi:ubiquinone/menaquinone biosynthesis C-methylase UbiE
MGIYHQYVLPRLIDLVMQHAVVTAERAKLVPLATGTVLEVGIGSGRNLPFYSPQVEILYGLDPSWALWQMAFQRVTRASCPVVYLRGSGEQIPLTEARCDTVVSTCTLCSIPQPLQALHEIKRVLKPDGQLLFIEHGRSPDSRVSRWQHGLTPLWRRLSGGCHLDRTIDALILAAGFRMTQLETGYMQGPRLLTFLYKGVAQPR